MKVKVFFSKYIKTTKKNQFAVIFGCKRMPTKRKGNGYLEQILQMKKLRREEAAVVGQSSDGRPRPSENVFFKFKADTASEMLLKILEQASPDDIIGEYIWFLKNMPKLLNNQESDLIHLVRSELGVENLKLCGKVNFKGSNFPILDALSCKLGMSLRHILAPPTTSCLLCGKDLIANHKPAQVPLHSVNGPGIASKYGWECRGCCGADQFRSVCGKSAG